MGDPPSGRMASGLNTSLLALHQSHDVLRGPTWAYATSYRRSAGTTVARSASGASTARSFGYRFTAAARLSHMMQSASWCFASRPDSAISSTVSGGARRPTQTDPELILPLVASTMGVAGITVVAARSKPTKPSIPSEGRLTMTSLSRISSDALGVSLPTLTNKQMRIY